MKISEGSFSDFKKRFVLDGYGGFQDKARECGIDKLDFSIGVKHKKPDLPDFPSGRLQFYCQLRRRVENIPGFYVGR